MRVESQESRVESQNSGLALRSCNLPSAQPPAPSPQPPRRGLTLIELLVVIIILTTIVAAAIPVLAPADDDRRNREAVRGLNTFIAGAQTRAIAYNRPFGIALKRLGQDTGRPEDNGVCLELFYVEQQPPYAGFDANSRARLSLYTPANSSLYGGLRSLVLIQFVTRGNGVAVNQDGLPTGWDPDLFPGVSNPSEKGGVIRPGDVLEINGTQYQLLADPDDGDVVARLDASNTYYRLDTGRIGNNNNKATQIVAQALNDTGQQINPTHDSYGADVANPTLDEDHVHFFTYPAPYKILRQAVPTSDQPYQLPEGAAIDLRASGVGRNDYFYWPDENDNTQGVLIMFAPEGRVSRVSFSQLPITPLDGVESATFDKSVVDNIFLLVGKRENVPVPAATVDPTLQTAKLTAATTDEQRQELKAPINWLVGTSRWVVIGSQSGRIATIENAAVDPLAVINKYIQQPTVFAESSEKMRAAQILTAREYTREMGQVGGR